MIAMDGNVWIGANMAQTCVPPESHNTSSPDNYTIYYTTDKGNHFRWLTLGIFHWHTHGGPT